MIDILKEKIYNIPDSPGCYFWLGDSETNIPTKNLKLHNNKIILYIGKANSLKKRIRQYLTSNDYKTSFLMKRVIDIDWVITNTETEALLLENNLIKQYTPPYNIKLKDNKNYPFLCLTLSEPYPRLILNRRKINPLDKYFGPFPDVKAAKNTLAFIHKIFPIRKRNLKLPLSQPGKPCINFHIKRCWGPCTGVIKTDEYLNMILEIQKFLEGKTQEVEKNLYNQMQQYAIERNYEQANRIKNLLLDIKTITEKQEMDNINTMNDIDIITLFYSLKEDIFDNLNINNDDEFLNFYGDSQYLFAQIVVLKIRSGKLIHKQSYALNETSAETNNTIYEEMFLEGFLRDYYISLNHITIPHKIYIAISNPTKNNYEWQSNWIKNWEEIITQKANHTVEIIAHTNNHDIYIEYDNLIKMGITNAKLTLKERLLSEKIRNQRIGLRQLQKLLNLKILPEYIECYDISNFQGQQAVASGVVLKNGLPYKTGYRKYKIQMENTPNDPAMIFETLERRFKHLLIVLNKQDTKNSNSLIPNLIVIDGGITQLNAALKARANIIPHDFHTLIPIISLAKQEEEIYYPLENNEYKILKMDPNSPGMLILRLARDEAHRFALTYHRKLRNKNTFLS